MQLAVGNEEFGAGAEALGADSGIGDNGAHGAGRVHEAEGFEIDGFEAGALGEDMIDSGGRGLEGGSDFGADRMMEGGGVEDVDKDPKGEFVAVGVESVWKGEEGG